MNLSSIKKIAKRLACGVAVAGALIAATPAPATANGNYATQFYAVAHMANNLRSVAWAVGQGANGLEMDLQFHADGAVHEFRHGGVCDCTLLSGKDSICEPLGDSCNARADAREMMRTVAANADRVALLIIDSKVDDLSPASFTAAGRNVIDLVESELIAHGYRGKVIVSAGKLRAHEYIRSAAARAKERGVAVTFAFDQTGGSAKDAATALAYLAAIPEASSRAFGTGISSAIQSDPLASKIVGTYHEAIQKGVELERSNKSSLTYVWTVDRKDSMNAYIDDGARAILSNAPGLLAQVAVSRGLELAKPSTSLTPIASNKIDGAVSDCSCDYRKTGSVLGFPTGGCRITRPALPGNACRCDYLPMMWTCRGTSVSCSGGGKCGTPDATKDSCTAGRGDCGGY